MAERWMEEMTPISLASAHSTQCDPPALPAEAMGAMLRTSCSCSFD